MGRGQTSAWGYSSSFSTIVKVLDNLGFQLSIRQLVCETKPLKKIPVTSAGLGSKATLS